jgi:hypothetical protein
VIDKRRCGVKLYTYAAAAAWDAATRWVC